MKLQQNRSGVRSVEKLTTVIRSWSIVIALVLIWVTLSIVSEHFFTLPNITNIFIQCANSMMVAIGMTFILISGHIDLSMGSIEALASTITAVIAVKMGLPVALALIMAIGAGALSGFFSGFLVAQFRFPPFIATLAMQGIIRGIALILTGSAAILISSDIFRTIGTGKVLTYFPVPTLIYVVLLLLATVILKYTRFGVNVYAVGSNEHAALLSGVNVKWTKIAVFILSGAMAACGGIVLAARLGSGNASIGETDVMDAVAAVVIGGTSMRGGVGSIRGTFVGVMIIGSIRNGLNLLAVGSYWQLVFIGLIIIVAVIIDQFSKGEMKK